MNYIANEGTRLLEKGSNSNIAASMSGSLGTVIGVLQVAALAVIIRLFSYDDVNAFTTEKYIIFRDIMVMLLLGFGFLMTFLDKYGLGAVGLTMLFTVLNMECNLIVENVLSGSTQISMDSMINAEFSAAALLISFGALIGRATPIQMCFISILEAIFYAINKVIIVNGLIKAEDVGGTITIHMFGAYFGLACAAALGPQQKESACKNTSSRVSDVFALVGTTLLWVYWPSFVSATETDVPENEMHCLINTIMALIGSTGATFFLTQQLNGGKFDAVHVQNSTLAGGVAIGATARLALGPGVAFLIGLLAGLVSVLGYFYSSPFLEEKFGIYDTCGVGNLHGYPSVLGGLLSILLVYVDIDADFLFHGAGVQSLMQLLAVVATLVMGVVTGYLSTKVTNMIFRYSDEHEDYEDSVWWIDVD
eukprot:CAMPEP_0172489502 /NCGR_PEP_ID=MMETSP1066-20121228/19538_1 /TAXON_ID=671091 /ORGANISM="Coscinodiscus wailesii, Strain CCMP2513" /LENGTH=420 /DNA_ID=CAMNT_0013257421 /DNA_START=29 /DNA_END=1291 /DNA_ORIENTATION=+